MRGVASVEAVIVAPVFVIVFASLFYVRDQALAKYAAESEARTCAWLYSAANCTLDPKLVPESCRAVLSDAMETDDGSDVGRAIADGKNAVLDAARGGDAGTSDLISSVVGRLVGPALAQAFDRSGAAATEQKFDRPRLYGGDMAVVTGRYRLACNLAPRTVEDVAKDAWSLFRP